MKARPTVCLSLRRPRKPSSPGRRSSWNTNVSRHDANFYRAFPTCYGPRPNPRTTIVGSPILHPSTVRFHGSTQKVLGKVLSGASDANVRFDDLRSLLVSLGFVERNRGGHHIFTRAQVNEILNLQPRPDGKAKPYQVKQVREVIRKYRLDEVWSHEE